MKIGIITFHAALNNGAVLQAYALQTFLRNMGHEVEFINYRGKRKYTIRDYVAKKPIRLLYKLLDRFNAYRFEKFKNFGSILNRGNIEYTNLADLQNAPPLYDVYIAGSDQIWNLGASYTLNKVYFLDFGTKKIKKIAYAASMGQCNVPEYLNQTIFNLLLNFSFISLREFKAYTYVQTLFGDSKKIYQVPDPTFLITKFDYQKLLDLSVKIKKPYIASYILAEFGKEQKLAINYIKKIKKHSIVNLRNPDTCVRLHGATNIIVSPSEWLNYIFNSEFNICCSFHAVVFSLIFHKPFIVVTPYENERINSLLSLMNLKSRIVIKFDELLINQILNDVIDWNFIDIIIKEERKNGTQFLHESLK